MSDSDAKSPPLEHIGRYTLDPGTLPDNIENFTGVAQVPLGLACPMGILEGTRGATSTFRPAAIKSTLVASYDCGMRLLTECGDVKTTVV